MRNVKIKFVPYERFKRNNVKSFLKDLKENTIIMVDAKLTPEEEANLIKETMEKVSTAFSGIELSSLDMEELTEMNGFERAKAWLIQLLAGKKRGLTIIGPAKVVHKIEKNPQELLVHM